MPRAPYSGRGRVHSVLQQSPVNMGTIALTLVCSEAVTSITVSPVVAGKYPAEVERQITRTTSRIRTTE